MHDKLEEIFAHIEEQYPQEACGILGKKNGEVIWKVCGNIADDPINGFEMNKRDYMKAVLELDRIEAIVHSHTDEPADPSDHDIAACNFLKIPYVIISWPSKEMKVVEPGEYDNPNRTL